METVGTQQLSDVWRRESAHNTLYALRQSHDEAFLWEFIDTLYQGFEKCPDRDKYLQWSIGLMMGYFPHSEGPIGIKPLPSAKFLVNLARGKYKQPSALQDIFEVIQHIADAKESADALLFWCFGWGVADGFYQRVMLAHPDGGFTKSGSVTESLGAGWRV